MLRHLIAVSAFLLAAPFVAAAPPVRLQTEVVHLEHRTSQEALAVVRPLLSSLGAVEEQPTANDLVLRDIPEALARVKAALAAFDAPPRKLHFDIHLIQAGPASAPIVPLSSLAINQPDLAPELLQRLRGLLRYESYQVLAWAGVTALEGSEVSRSLGSEYAVRFRTGSALRSGRLKLEGFSITKAAIPTVLKGPRVPPRQLFNASLNLQLERPFALVLADEPKATGPAAEGLLVAIVGRQEGGER